MVDRPPPESALHRLKHEELCIITLDGKELEATWSANNFRFYFKGDLGVHSISHVNVEQWRPAGGRFRPDE
jgi:hypothetical protein